MANRNEQETEIRRRFLSRRPHLSFELTERYPDDLNLPTVEHPPLPTFSDVDMIVGDSSAVTGSNRNYTAFQLSLELEKKEDLKCEEQRATYYIGGICCLMPQVTDDIQEGVRQKGNIVRIVRVPSGAEPNGLVIPEKKANAFFGYLVIMLHKNVTESNFGDLSDRHLKELFDAAGYAPRQGKYVSVFNVAYHAMDYRCFGQMGRIKESVLKGILNHSKVNDSFGKVCSCVAKNLSWIEKSSKSYIVEREKFAKLIAIAEKIMMKTTNVISASWLCSYA